MALLQCERYDSVNYAIVGIYEVISFGLVLKGLIKVGGGGLAPNEESLLPALVSLPLGPEAM